MPYPSSLYAFSKYFSLRIIEEYNLGADLVDVLENYVENALFYRLGEYLKKYDYSIMNEKDKHWCKQQIWLRGVGMKQLGINEIYRGNDEKEEEGEENIKSRNLKPKNWENMYKELLESHVLLEAQYQQVLKFFLLFFFPFFFFHFFCLSYLSFIYFFILFHFLIVCCR